MGDDRAASADAPRSTHADRRAPREGVSEQDRLALAARSDGIPLYLEELVRAGTAQRPVIVGDAAPMPGLGPARSTSRSSRASTRHRGAPGRRHRGGRRTGGRALAARRDHDDSARGCSTPPSGTSLTQGSSSPSRDRPARYQFRHELLREVSYELQPPSWRRKVHSRLCDCLTREEPGDWLVLASHFERAERYQEAADAYQQLLESARRRGALEEARSYLARAIDLIEPLRATRCATIWRSTCGCGAASSRCRRGCRQLDAAADLRPLPRARAGGPGGDAMFSTLISLWAYHLSRAELERARSLRTLRTALAGARDYFRPQNLAGFGMLDWFGGSFGDASTHSRRATRIWRDRRRRRHLAMWFVPNDADVGDVRASRARPLHGSRPGGRRASLARAASPRKRSTSRRALERRLRAWLASWMWIEVRPVRRGRRGALRCLSSSELARLRQLGADRATQTAALEALAALCARHPTRPRLRSGRTARAGSSSSGRRSSCGSSSPST